MSARRRFRAWSAAPVAPIQTLLHPAWIAGLAVLVLNDHVFKGGGILPAWLTGKLSDFSGLLIAPALFALLLQVRTRGRLLLAHAAVGVVFAALDLSPALTTLWRVPFAALGIGWQSAHDPTDLVALPMLILSFRLTARAPAPAARSLAEHVLAVAGMVASMATSQEQQPQPPPTPPCTDCDGDGWPAGLDCDDNDATVNPGLGNCPVPVIEQSCDDGVDDDHDGLVDCDDPDCAEACAAVEATCAAAPAAQSPLTGTTLGKTSTMKGSCVGADAPEAVFAFTPPAVLGILTIDAPPGHGVYLRTACASPASELACVPPGDGASLSILIGPAPLHVVVDAASALDAADFSVAMLYQPLVCGDGIVVGPEECDDGNTLDGDGCSSTCTLEGP
jgi:cysteine-rich repeat protein